MISQHRFKSKHADAVYHCISRTISGEKLFDDEAKEILRKQLHQVADFSGVEILTYTIMSNHFHILVRVNEQKNVSDEELLRRYKVLYPKPNKWNTVQIELIAAAFKENGADAERIRKQLLARMGDLSEFMKTLKQRYTIWFNRNHKRFGPLWAERFTSIIIEGSHHFSLQMMAAYIDLNPVRAGLVRDPKDYHWSGYGEAEAIGGKMLAGLRQVVSGAENLSDKEVLAAYRVGLYGKGAAAKRGDPKAARISSEDFAAVQKADGKLTGVSRVRLRVSWFTRGAVIGSCGFVKEHLNEYRGYTRKRRHLEPKVFSTEEGNEWSEIYSMRARD